MSNNKAATPFYEQIDGEEVTGWVAPEGQSYRAWATFRRKLILVRGRTESDAINQWRRQANSSANE